MGTTVYHPRPRTAARGAILWVRQYGKGIPAHFLMGDEHAESLSRDVDPPGIMLLEMYEGVPIIVNDELYGCELVYTRPLDLEVPLSAVNVEWDDDDSMCPECGEFHGQQQAQQR